MTLPGSSEPWVCTDFTDYAHFLNCEVRLIRGSDCGWNIYL